MSIPRHHLHEHLRALWHKRNANCPRLREIARSAIPNVVARLRAEGIV